MSKEWIGVDLDRTLATYESGDSRNPLVVGAPVEKMVNRVKRWTDKGITVKIFTARIVDPETGQIMPEVIQAVKEWCKIHIGKELEVTNAKDPHTIAIWDDIAVNVVRNTGEITHPVYYGSRDGYSGDES